MIGTPSTTATPHRPPARAAAHAVSIDSADLTASSGHGLRVLDRDVVPAVGRQIQDAPRAGRVLVLDAGDEITYQLLRGNGPLLTESSVVLTERALHADETERPLGQAVAALVGVSGEEAAPLADLGVAAVVPAAPSTKGPVRSGTPSSPARSTDGPVRLGPSTAPIVVAHTTSDRARARWCTGARSVAA